MPTYGNSIKQDNGVNMDKKHTVQRISNKKRGRPKVRFNLMVVIIITALTFVACFVLYMINANITGDVLDSDDSSTTTTIKTTEAVTDENGTSAESEDASQAEETTEAAAQQNNSNIAYPVPQSEEADSSYFENCCLISDQTLLSMSQYSDFKDVLGSSQLNASNCNETSITSSYGNVTPYQTIQLKKPQNLYIMLGSDIGTSSIDDMISGYTKLITSLHNYLPEMKIYVMQYPPAPAESTTVTTELVDSYNTRLMDMAKSIGVYCLDTNTPLRSSEGTIDGDYWDDDSAKLTEDACKTIGKYILNHTA